MIQGILFFVVTWLVLELIAGIIGGRFERVFPVTNNASNKTISRKRQKIIAGRIREGIENSEACAIIYCNIEPPSAGVRVSIDLRGLSIQEKVIAYLAMIDLFGPDIAKQDVFYTSHGVAYSTPTKETNTMQVYVKDFVE